MRWYWVDFRHNHRCLRAPRLHPRNRRPHRSAARHRGRRDNPAATWRLGDRVSCCSSTKARPVRRYRKSERPRQCGGAFDLQWALLAARMLYILAVAIDKAAELLHRPHVELANALLRDAELLADLLERHALGVVQAGPQADDLAL